MKKRIAFLIFCLLVCLGSLAQELNVKSFSLVATDISAQTQLRKDLNDEPCALVKVQFVGDILDVEGNVIKPLVKKGNETWVYMDKWFTADEGIDQGLPSYYGEFLQLWYQPDGEKQDVCIGIDQADKWC